MSELVSLFLLPPIARGFLAMIFAGLCFPSTGVIILRMELVPLRYTLMHSVILGGVLALGLHLPVTLTTIVISFILVAIMGHMKDDPGATSATFMVLSMGLASLLMHILNVPAKDSLELLWGSPFALTKIDIYILISLTIMIFLYILLNFRTLTALFFDEDIAVSSGISLKFHKTFMLIITSAVVAVAMKIMGALLVDAILILPSFASIPFSNSLKESFKKSTITGLSFSILGYLISVIFSIPVSGTISVIAVIWIFIIKIIRRK